jgi:CelD/BcsL family acetyltransferase involved in cellulose biosynthesis
MILNDVDIRFEVAARRLWGVRRSLVSISFTLDDLIAGTSPTIDPLPGDAEGYRYLSAPQSQVQQIKQSHRGFLFGDRGSYSRYYIDMEGDYAKYLAKFSSKTRSTLSRKKKKWTELNGGQLGVREYRTTAELTEFLEIAIKLSALTYQERLLGAGLPATDAAKAEAHALAAKDSVRSYLLFHGERAVSYLYLPVEGGIISYAHLGYDPEYAKHSVGTVLQMAALERLFAEKRYRYFDFTEGEGSHKEMFGTNSIPAASFILLKPTIANRALLRGVGAFDEAIAWASETADRHGVKAKIRRVLRGS